jgi:hypothetical protein
VPRAERHRVAAPLACSGPARLAGPTQAGATSRAAPGGGTVGVLRSGSARRTYGARRCWRSGVDDGWRHRHRCEGRCKRRRDGRRQRRGVNWAAAAGHRRTARRTAWRAARRAAVSAPAPEQRPAHTVVIVTAARRQNQRAQRNQDEHPTQVHGSSPRVRGGRPGAPHIRAIPFRRLVAPGTSDSALLFPLGEPRANQTRDKSPPMPRQDAKGQRQRRGGRLGRIGTKNRKDRTARAVRPGQRPFRAARRAQCP